MARNTSVSLGDHFVGFIDERIASGRYNSASDVIRAGLRLLEEHEARVEAPARRPHRGRAIRPRQPVRLRRLHRPQEVHLSDMAGYALTPAAQADFERR